MSTKKGRDTGLEIALRKALWKNGIRGYRTNMNDLPERPDLVFANHRLANSVHECFWHRCPVCQTITPKTHIKFWTEKFERNEAKDARDLENLKALKEGPKWAELERIEGRKVGDSIIRPLDLCFESNYLLYQS